MAGTAPGSLWLVLEAPTGLPDDVVRVPTGLPHDVRAPTGLPDEVRDTSVMA